MKVISPWNEYRADHRGVDVVAQQQRHAGGHQQDVDERTLAQNGGTIVVVGVPTGPVTVEWPLVQDKELRIQGTAMYTGEDVQQAINLVRAGVPVERLVSAELPLERVADAFALAEGGTEINVHVVVDE